MEPKQEQFIADLQAHLQKGAVSTEEMVTVISSVLRLISDLQGRLQDTIETHRGEGARGSERLKQDIFDLKGDVEQLRVVLSNTEHKLTGDTEQKVLGVFDEIRRIESLIPGDPSPALIERIVGVEGRIPKLPEELSAEKVRDKLETLEDDDRLDASAIKNLPKSVRNIVSSGGIIGGSSGIKGVAAGTNIAVDGNPYTPMVTLNITASVTPPPSPVVGELWIQL